MKISDLVINFFESKQLNTAFTVSGGGCIHLIDSLRKSNISSFCVHHEQAALMASEGYYRLNNKMSLNIVTTGPGGTNTLTGVLGLWLDSIPSIIISGQVQRNQMSEGTGCRQIGDQEFDIVKIVSSMTKYAKTILNPNDILHELNKAYNIALHGRQGPVWIDIPLDIQGMEVDITQLDSSDFVIKNPEIYEPDLINFQKMVNNSKKPLIVIGNGIRTSNCFNALEQFLNKTNIPIVTGPHSGVDAVDHTYEYYCGRIGILGQLTSNQIVQDADLLIILGSRLPYKMTGYNIKEFSPNSKKIIVDIDENEIKKHKFNIDLKIIGDLNDLFNKINTYDYNLNIGDWRVKTKKLRSTQQCFHPKHENMTDYTSFYYLISKAPSFFQQTPIITSNGTAHVVPLQMYKLNKSQRLFTNAGCASMGFGLPAAIGAAIANKNDVICIEGDGSMMMNLQELQTIKTYKLPVKIILINNDGYLSIKMTQESFFNGQEFASGPTNGVTLPSYQNIANAFDIPYLSIKTNSDIDAVLSQFVSATGAVILEVFTHPKEKHEPKVVHKGVDKDGRIIPGTLDNMFISDTI
jgi:acetolactate synthase-1/2/3 large subunit